MLPCLPLWAMLLLVAGPLAADEPAKIPADRVIGSVYGKPIKAGDVGLTAPIDVSKRFGSDNDAMWDQMGRIQQALGGPILERFIKERKIEATDGDAMRFQELVGKKNQEDRAATDAKLAVIEKQLAGDQLTKEARTTLEKEKKTLETSTPVPIPPDAIKSDILKQMLLHWKIERELHRRYGGRIIFQQFGAEALDARRLLCEEAEKAGDLKFDDPGVRHLFYYYANMRHTVISDGKEPEQWRIFDEAK